MTRAIVLIACAQAVSLIVNAVPARSQTNKPPNFDAKTIQGDYAVPDAPAIVMLNGDQSKLLRPSSVQELTSNLATKSGDFSFIPKAFGVEFSPAMLLQGPKLSIAEYQANPIRYRTRLSMAAKKDDDTNRSQLAIALRLSLDDRSDLRTNPDFLEAIDRLTSMKVDNMRAVTFALSAAKVPLFGRSPAQQEQAEAIEKRVADSLRDAVGDEELKIVSTVKRAREATQWNADVMDVAVGWRASSADSVGKKSRVDGFAGWFTKGWRVSGASQLLFGLRGAYERDSTFREFERTGDATARFYVGGNTAKVSFEGQGSGRQASPPKWGLQLGGEFQAGKSFWIELGAGWRSTGALSRGGLTHSIKFQLAPPNQ